MNTINRFYALSAVYLGLASAVGAQGTATQTPAPGSGVVEDARQDRFQHPLLEQPSSTDLRSSSQDEPRIQRRGLQGTQRDGDIRRNVEPSATQADRALKPERREEDRHPRKTQ